MRYGGEAAHGHAPTHVGAVRSIGPSTEPNRKPRIAGDTVEDWPERHRTYPSGRRGPEQYGHEHHHGEESEDWVLGAPPAGTNR